MYSVDKHRYGVIVTGPVPISHFCGLVKIFEADGLDLLDTGIASHIGATIVATSKAASDAWRNDLGIKNDEQT